MQLLIRDFHYVHTETFCTVHIMHTVKAAWLALELYWRLMMSSGAGHVMWGIVFLGQTLPSTDHQSELIVNLLQQIAVNIQIILQLETQFTFICPAKLTVICYLCPFVWVVNTLFLMTLVWVLKNKIGIVFSYSWGKKNILSAVTGHHLIFNVPVIFLLMCQK